MIPYNYVDSIYNNSFLQGEGNTKYPIYVMTKIFVFSQ